MNQMREALEKAFNEHEEPEDTEETGGSPENTEEPVRDTEPEPTPEPEQSEPEPEPEAEPDTEGDETAAPEEKPDTHRAEAIKPPQSWRPAVREHWSKLPGEVQAEISKREVEITRALTQTAGARRLEQEFYQVVSPYEPIIRAANSTPMAMISNLMQTSARLYLGNPQQKALVAFEIIRNFGIDLQTLDSMLAGQMPPPEEDKFARMLDQRLGPVNQFMQRINTGLTQRQEQSQQTVAAEIDEFSSHDFFEDVREDMADLMEIAAKRGVALTLQDAYDRAIAARPDLRSILDQRQAAQSAVSSQQRIEKARRAASSVTGAPAPSGKQEAGKDLRADIANAWSSLARN